MKRAGKVRCNMRAIVKGYSRISQSFVICAAHAVGYREADKGTEGMMMVGNVISTSATSNEVYDLKWGHDLANRISGQIKTEIGRIRASPPLIPIVPGA